MTTGATDPLLWRRWAEADRLLDAALDLPVDQREMLVRQEAGDDVELRNLVLGLLANVNADRSDGLGPPEDVVLAAFSSGEPIAGLDAISPGEIIGRYRIVGRIGRGGMATVYEAERADGVYEQRVALKVLRRGIDTEDLVRRFLAERQILSSLSHPNIARLIDGGSSESGRPYLVMELVSGEPITIWADNRRLDLRARLGLFQAVASAVSEAHRRLVVHRDIKPSNILVDGDGNVKLLDFGIAKLLDRDEAFTATGAAALTPEYASPEQSAGGAITTGTDVYQLGILLRELLTGLPPRAVNPAEADRTAVRASRLASRELTGVARPAERAAARATTPERLSRALRGDLDIIIGKATRPESGERYGSVDDLSSDVRRYLDGRAILAHPESLGYRLRKFAFRNPVGLAFGLLAALMLVGFTAALVLQNRRIIRERDGARVATDRAVQTQRFLVDLLRTADPTTTGATTRNPDITVGEALQRGRARVERELNDQPEVKAALLSAMGQTFSGLGRFETADTLLRQAHRILVDLHGDDNPRVVPPLIDLADNFKVQRDFRSADSLYHLATGKRASLPADTLHATLLGLMSQTRRDLGDTDSALTLASRAVALRHKLNDTTGSGFLGSLGSLAYALRGADRLDSAGAVYRSVIERLERDPSSNRHTLALQYNNLGFLLRTQSKYAGADSAYRAGLAVAEQALGRGHVATLLIRQNLASALELAGRLDEAHAVARDLIRATEEEWPEGHWRTGAAYLGLGRSLLRNGRPGEAVPFIESGVSAYAKARGSDAEATVIARLHLGAALLLSGQGRQRFDDAMRPLRSRDELGADSRAFLTTLAGVLDEAGHDSIAEELRRLVTRAVR